ncbi:MAG: polysaccharide pyruvyl transferase family protein [Dorea sp.]|nr:polysaccharide pyruvyl transferase family protein [Dorea sp.]
MKKYLMRGGMSPLDVYTPDQVHATNSIGANSGNLLYAFGVYRTLMTEDVQIDMDYYGVERSYTDADIDRINEEYDAYICPLADAFRDEFRGKLLKYAHFFDRLTIPCYVIGMGIRAKYGQNLKDYDYTMDEEAKIFLKALLNKSAMVGLRGEITGGYLKHLGFVEEKDFRVIGCPSMYMYGRDLHQRSDFKFDENGLLLPETKLSFNMSSKTPANIISFLASQMDRFEDYYCVEQNENEMALLYYGLDYNPRQDVNRDFFPTTVNHPLIQQDRYKMFINVRTWNEFMKGRDLSVGSKLHGNVAALISGCPALFLPLDGRMQELINYHKFASVPYEEVKENDTIESLLERVDITAVAKQQAENFDRYVDFLNINGLDHIYKEDLNRTVAPVDLIMDQRDYPVPDSILHVDNAEAIRRFNSAYYKAKKEVGKFKGQANRAKKELAESQKIQRTLEKENERLKRELERANSISGFLKNNLKKYKK